MPPEAEYAGSRRRQAWFWAFGEADAGSSCPNVPALKLRGRRGAASRNGAPLFGASTPLAKRLLPQVEPVLMVGLALFWLRGRFGSVSDLRSSKACASAQDAPLTRRDAPWPAVAIVAGGVAGLMR